MNLENNSFEWQVTSGSALMKFCWRWLGSVGSHDGYASFPPGPENPGVYMVKLTACGTHRIYIGEAANLGKRLRGYGGRGAEHPNRPGMTTTNMKARVRRVLRERDGEIEVYLLELPACSGLSWCEHYPACKDCRVMLERLALATAYLRREPLINEHGFPKVLEDNPLL